MAQNGAEVELARFLFIFRSLINSIQRMHVMPTSQLELQKIVLKDVFWVSDHGFEDMG